MSARAPAPQGLPRAQGGLQPALGNVAPCLAEGFTPTARLSRVEFLGEMSDVLHSRAPFPLIPPTPISHKG